MASNDWVEKGGTVDSKPCIHCGANYGYNKANCIFGRIGQESPEERAKRDKATAEKLQAMIDALNRGKVVHEVSGESKPTEIRVTDPKTGGQKGMKDCQIGAVDPLAVWEVGRIAGFGAEKYERYNFAKGYRWSLSYDALQRHLMAFWGGEDKDPESGLHHVAHAAWHCLALLTFMLRNKGTDDRFPTS